MFNWESLSDPFAENQVHWRVGRKTKDRTSAMVLAYLDARDVMNRLDAVVGPENWSDEYTETASGRVICKLSIKTRSGWVSKSDAAGDTAVEGEKGAVSDAFKRAAVKFGIGRYLYYLGQTWVTLNDDGGFINPKLPDSAKPGNMHRYSRYGKALDEHFTSIAAIKSYLADGQGDAALEAWMEIPQEDQENLWIAPTYGGVFTTEERRIIKALESSSITKHAEAS